MKFLKAILKEARTGKGLLTREVAQSLGIDQALISKFENGSRKPTRDQLAKLAEVYAMDEKEILIPWLSEKIAYQLLDEEYGNEALQLAEDIIEYGNQKKKVAITAATEDNLKEIESLKKQLNKFRHLDSYRIAQALELEYTFESNRIEGNSLTLRETDLVVNEGLTISGKSMREHLEAVNHAHAIEFVKELVNKKTPVTERTLLQIHNLILRGVDNENAGRYRTVQVMIKGSKHTPPQPFLVPKQMEEYFVWYQKNKKHLHPAILAAEMHEKLVTVHPFIDGNGRTARLLMNLILLQHGFVIANIKGDTESRMAYYDALEKVQTGQSNSLFIEFVAKTEADALKQYLRILS
jgi:Fic family protein/plasmid maintenance system antidote protein VapI